MVLQLGEFCIRQTSIYLGTYCNRLSFVLKCIFTHLNCCFSHQLHSLDWNYAPSDSSYCVEQYEEAREPHRRNQAQLKIPSRIRLQILRDEWECSLKSIMAAQVEASKERKKRMRSSMKARRAIQREEQITAMKDSLKKVFQLFKKDDNKDGSSSSSLPTFPPESTETVSDSSDESSNILESYKTTR